LRKPGDRAGRSGPAHRVYGLHIGVTHRDTCYSIQSLIND
jgi:hypothetical protein